jgi:tetratricopeptide (TPR) repeat protein
MTDRSSRAADDAATIDGRWDFNDPVASEAAFRALLDARDAPPDEDYRDQVRTQIARSLSLQRRFDDAHALLDEIEPSLDSRPPLVRIRHALERGRTLNSSGRRDEARPLFLRAWEEAGAIGADFYTVDAAHMLGIVDPPDDAMRWNEIALETAEGSRDPRARRWIGSLCNNMGWTRHAQEAFDEAMTLFERALDARREEGKPREIRVARWCVARCRRSLGAFDEALAEQRRLQSACDAAGEPDGFVAEEIAECLHALGRAEEARPFFARAHGILSLDPWLAESEPERLERLERLARSPVP